MGILIGLAGNNYYNKYCVFKVIVINATDKSGMYYEIDWEKDQISGKELGRGFGITHKNVNLPTNGVLKIMVNGKKYQDIVYSRNLASMTNYITIRDDGILFGED